MAEPYQLPLFPDHARLIRIRPERNEWRFYRKRSPEALVLGS